jgi:hypothetical protein
MNSPPPSEARESFSDKTPSELIHLLIRGEDRVPRALIDECAQRGEAMLDELDAILQKDYYWSDDLGEGEWWLRLHAVMILGLMSHETAGELLVGYMQRMDEAGDENLDEWFFGYWPALFRNKPVSIVPALRAFAEDGARGIFLRVNALDAAVALSEHSNPAALDEALAWVAHIAFDDNEDEEVRMFTGSTLLDYARPEYRKGLEALADLEPEFGAVFTRDEIEQQYAAGPGEHEWDRLSDPWSFYTPDAIAERQARWAAEELDDDTFEDAPGETYVRPSPKIGRNDPCPCGSGKKYKKCCMPQ